MTALLVAGLLLGACGDDDDDGDQAAVTSIPEETTTSSTTTTEPRTVAPDVIPQDESQITEEYVEQVVDAIYVVYVEAMEHTRSVNLVDETTTRLIGSISSEPHSIDAVNSLIELAQNDFAGFRSELQPVTTRVTAIIESGEECVFAEATLDSSGLVEEEQSMPDGVRTFVRLVPASEEQRASGENPTAWVIDALPATDDGTVPGETCPSV